LPAELQLLKLASEALAHGDVTRGRRLLREHRQRFAVPILRQEREGLELVARCQQNDAQARAQAAAFLAANQATMVAVTIRKACKLEPAR
jgi:hypothetical protein